MSKTNDPQQQDDDTVIIDLTDVYRDHVVRVSDLSGIRMIVPRGVPDRMLAIPGVRG